MFSSVWAKQPEITEARLPCLMHDDRFRVEILMSSAERPVGVVHDEGTGATFVAEPERNRVRILFGDRITAIDSFRFIYLSRESESRTSTRMETCMHSRLRQPTDLALTRDRTLYVSECAPGGRLLAFDLTRGGAPAATVVTCASQAAPGGYCILALDDRERLLALPRGHTGNPQALIRFRRVSAYRWAPDGYAPLEAMPSSRHLANYFGVTSAEDHPVLQWIEQQPSLTRVFCCRHAPHAYAAIRQAGLVVRISPHTLEIGDG